MVMEREATEAMGEVELVCGWLEVEQSMEWLCAKRPLDLDCAEWRIAKCDLSSARDAVTASYVNAIGYN